MRIAILCFLLVANAAHAQMFKCVLPGGKVEYRGSACDDAKQDTPIHGSVSNVPAMPRQDIRRAVVPTEPSGPTMTVIGGEKPGIPSEREIKNLETSASSRTLSQKEKKFMQDEVRRAKLARENGAEYTDRDKNDLDYLRSSQTRVDPADRERARQRAEEIHMRAGGDAVREDVTATRQAEQARSAARRAAAQNQGQLVNCDPNGCWDTNGVRYDRAGGGNFTRSDGKFCTPIAGGVNCF
jgi:hypothetical protein